MIQYNEEKKQFEGRIKSLDEERWIAIKWKLNGTNLTMEDVRALQIIVYTMCGGGLLGEFAMRQPADFYIDLRHGRLPYPNKRIYHAVEILRGVSLYLGLNPHNLSKPMWYNGAIF